ncbi:MAG: hypothetical protein NTX50_06535 [Candidatus Sumerlaeota bacterium]|nr:hypothetical protein [Candidatus Sumerlaeota bacterium]
MDTMDPELKARCEHRRKTMVGHRAANFEEAEKWDLEFWQSQTPQQRLEALMAIFQDMIQIEKGKLQGSRESE